MPHLNENHRRENMEVKMSHSDTYKKNPQHEFPHIDHINANGPNPEFADHLIFQGRAKNEQGSERNVREEAVNRSMHRSSSPRERRSGRKECLRADKPLMKSPHELSRKEKKKLTFNFLPELTKRYKCLRVLGSGSYGKVFECWDRERKIRVAIKCQSAYIADSVKREIHVMEKLRAAQIREQMEYRLDHPPQKYCIQLYDWFEMQEHNCICMVLEKCPHNLDDLIQENSERYPRGVSISLIKKWTYQILMALQSLHELDMVHSDLKPENIMLVSEDSSTTDEGKHSSCSNKRDLDVRLIDFGLSMHVDDIKTRVIGTRQFSAPEILLKIGWSKPLDMWALGCLVCELFTGRTLFDSHENLEHLAIMQAILGDIPTDLVQKCVEINDAYDMEAGRNKRDDNSPKKYFDSRANLRWPEMAADQESINFVSRRKKLEDLLRADRYPELYDFVSKLLRYRPEERMTAIDALNHPFLASLSSHS